MREIEKLAFTHIFLSYGMILKLKTLLKERGIIRFILVSFSILCVLIKFSFPHFVLLPGIKKN